jgi:GNAT superfamily N-acetyltransferase
VDLARRRCERLHDVGTVEVRALVADSERAGLTLGRRLVDEWDRGSNRFDRPGEALFGAWADGQLVGVCGLNIDPYAGDDWVGRVRHLYVRASARRLGFGRALVTRAIDAARGRFETLRLTTSNPDAARLYEAAGFQLAPARDCTHVLRLARCQLTPVAVLTEGDRGALAALTAAVYPPRVAAASPGRHLQWARPEHSMLVFAADELVAHVGLVVRAGMLDGATVTLGGVGGVKTHPRAEGRGYASLGMRRAAATLLGEHRVDFSLLVCQEQLQRFYARLGWQLFTGRLLVEQPGGSLEFTVNRPMVLPGTRPAPRVGHLDIRGLPW